MKKVLAVILAALLIIPNVFVTSAQTTVDTSSKFVVRTGADAWANDWNDGIRSLTVDLQGASKADYYYNCFTKYFEIKVADLEDYYTTPTAPYFYLKSVTDITEYVENGYLRFWISVPKDMTLNLELMSNDSGSYGVSGIKIDLKASDSLEGYQEVQVPLSRFFGSDAYTNSCDKTILRYIRIGGDSKATAESFLAKDESLKLSFFEIWSGTAPTPEPIDTTPVYYSKSGNYYIKDIYAALDGTYLISAFKDTLRKEEFTKAVGQFNEYASLLELYSVNLLNAGSEDYSTSQISNYVKVYIPLTDKMRNCELAVATADGGVLTQREFAIEDNSLVVTTNQLGDILIMNMETPRFTLSEEYYEQTEVTVIDNEKVDTAVLVATEVNSARPTVVYSQSGDKLIPLQTVCDWMESENGLLRFWIKAPWKQETPDTALQIGLCIKYNNGTSDVYPHATANISVKADGLWHETRISADSFSVTEFKKVLQNETYLAGYTAIYGRVRAIDTAYEITAGEGLYISKFDFFDLALSNEPDNGNVERTAFVLDGAKKDYVSDVSVSAVAVDDNRFVTEAKRITRKETTSDFSGKLLLPYSANVSVEEGETYNQLSGWFYNSGAEMRTYVKNESDSPVSFKIGLYGCLSYNSSTVYPKTVTKDYITLPANSGWQEIRITLEDTTPDRADYYFTKGTGYFALEIYTKKDEFLQETGDSILVSPLEIYSFNIVEDEATDFTDSYILAGVLESEYTSNNENTDNISKLMSENTELPYFTKQLTIKASDNYEYSGEGVYLFAEKPLFAADFAEWASDPQAQMRLWIKSDKARSFTLGLTAGGQEITADIVCEGKDGWQELVLSRSDFSTSEAFDSAFKYADTRHVYSVLYPTEEAFTADDEIIIGGRVEFFSELAYQKGDVNRDSAVNLKDLVKAKKLSSGETGDIVCCDIDSDGRLSALDLSYLRKWLLSNSWV